MNIVTNPSAAGKAAAPLSRPAAGRTDRADAIFHAAGILLPLLERGQSITVKQLGAAVADSFGGTDVEGFWAWKDAYEALEAAQVLFLRKFGPAIASRSTSASAMLAMLTKVARLAPTHIRRTQESEALQQFSTPIPLGFIAAHAAPSTAEDLVLEPSAGTGLLAVFATIARAHLMLNERSEARADLLRQLFPASPATRHDAAHIDDFLHTGVDPSIVLMNPPFSAGAHVEGHVADAAWRHLSSAFARLRPGGRLVAITGSGFAPENPPDGCVYARHGTTVETRLTVIYKLPADDPSRFVASPGKAPDVETLLAWVESVPPRTPRGYPNSIGALAKNVLSSVPDATVPRLKALDLMAEIISWKLRLFIPTSAEGPAVLARLMERHKLIGVVGRAALLRGGRS